MNIKTISIKSITKTHTIDFDKSITDTYYLSDIMDKQSLEYDRALRKSLKMCDSLDADFLQTCMFHAMYGSMLHYSFPVTNKSAIEVQNDIMIIKTTNKEIMHKIWLNPEDYKTDESITLAELVAMIELSFEPIDISEKYKLISKAYMAENVLDNFKIIFLATKNNRYMTMFIHKEFYMGELEDWEIPNPLGDMPEPMFEEINLEI